MVLSEDKRINAFRRGIAADPADNLHMFSTHRAHIPDAAIGKHDEFCLSE
jgi:hypothetical protein